MDVRDLQLRTKNNIDRFIGHLGVVGETSDIVLVRHFQNLTLSFTIESIGTATVVLAIQGAHNKNRFFDLGCDSYNLEYTSNGEYAITVQAEVTYFRVLWVSGNGGSTRIRNLHLTMRKTLT